MKQKKKDIAKYYILPAVLCLAGIIGFGCYYFLSGFTHQQETTYIFIDQDDTTDSIYQKLLPIGSRHGMTGLHTLLSYGLSNDHIHPGHYSISPDDNVLTVFQKLRNGEQVPIRITIPEVRTLDRLAGYLGTKLMNDSAAFFQLMSDSTFCQSIGYTRETLPALFIPNTYEVYWNISPERFVQRMQREHSAFWTAERQALADSLGLSPVEVSTMASILDEETANNSEKPMIAGMYMNRLRIGMPLQADPTVKYALGNFAIRRVLLSMLETDSPYNTYKHSGLPPGPIKIASIRGIDAVLHMVHHDYLFMCAKEDFSGTHHFARTFAEHQRNASRYAEALNKRGVR